ncbi:MAG TPA: iron-containing alcohol dehydrogenase [Propylenella sp.]|nr:iron-containing alcohol dehydrogenase [Propylenella sp.]
MKVKFGETSFDYYLERDAADRLCDVMARAGADSVIVVTDARILALHGERLLARLRRETTTIVLTAPEGESAKCFAVLETLCEKAIAGGATRRSLVLAMGGGSIGNVAGMLAGLLFRGIRLVHLPTTLMAAFDSVLSLKQAINCSRGKNLFGLYHPPEAIVADLQAFSTLEERDVRSGLCETVKNVVAIAPDTAAVVRERIGSARRGDADALTDIAGLSLAAKLGVMSGDPLEKAAGVVLEFGHTVGHAVELADFTRRGDAGLRHGEAVAIGMVVAARISALLARSDGDVDLLLADLLGEVGAPTALPPDLPVAEIIALVGKDNKRGKLACEAKAVPMVLLEAPGRPIWENGMPLVPASLRLIREALQAVR